MNLAVLITPTGFFRFRDEGRNAPFLCFFIGISPKTSSCLTHWIAPFAALSRSKRRCLRNLEPRRFLTGSWRQRWGRLWFSLPSARKPPTRKACRSPESSGPGQEPDQLRRTQSGAITGDKSRIRPECPMGIPVWESGVRINVPRKIVGGPRGPDDRGFRRMLTESAGASTTATARRYIASSDHRVAPGRIVSFPTGRVKVITRC
jgi:hypothetical protein